MKTSIKFFALLLSTLVVSGCGSCPCNKAVDQAPAVIVPKAVAAPVVTKVVQQPVPVAPVTPEPKKNYIPAAVRK